MNCKGMTDLLAVVVVGWLLNGDRKTPMWTEKARGLLAVVVVG